MAPTYQFNAKEVIEKGRVPQEIFDELKEWCTTEENLPPISDEQLIVFLLSCHNQLEQTKHTIHAYMRCRKEAPELFHNRDIDSEDAVTARKTVEFALLPVRTPHNESVVSARLIDTAYYRFHLEPKMKTLLMVGELGLHQEPPDGLIVLLDMKGCGLFHLTRLMKFSALKHFFFYVQEGFPCHLKQIHVLNTVYFIDKFLKIFKPFMKSELYNLIRFHSPNMKMETFFEEFLPADCVPQDYGGSLASMSVLSSETYDALRGPRMEQFYKEEEEQVLAYKVVKK